ncbi:ABC transporter ATP-binding protein [Brevibacillus sp. SYSU BS000544]|uniref:ABC transporter ATP-binding protein n=1 Tax=Brevibacillus sp. SYSU BS000544 TaxID=3416443 RepID=UPI003CE4D77A
MMIEIKGLSQSYQNKKVLENVNLTISENETCALVGRNGAGKSTFIHSMLGLLPVKEGSIQICGIDHKQEAWKKEIAYLPEKFTLYPQLTGDENIRFFASLEQAQVDEAKLEDCLRKVHLWDDRNERIKGYSKGMLQRLGLGIMLYYDSKIMILDEPTSGLDPIGRKEILSILKSLEKKTILFSSHHMDEIRQVCSHVAYLEDGTMTKYSMEEFNQKYQFVEE